MGEFLNEGTRMTQPTLHATYAFDIIHVLVSHAGLRDDADSLCRMAEAFTDPSLREYRFIGSLGFGGKFWCDGRWRVTCYREDDTPARLEAIAATNEALRELQATVESLQELEASIPPIEELMPLVKPQNPRPERYGD